MSCILRFIEPSYYGIISPPVESLLRCYGKNHVEKYLEYLKNLEELKDVFNLERIADVDVALWTLSKIISEPSLKYVSSYDHYITAYHNSENPVKQIITKNAFKELWSTEVNLKSYLDRAKILCYIDTKIAGIIAGQALELYIKKLCDQHDIRTWVKDKRGKRFLKIDELLEKLSIRRVITKVEEEKIGKHWKSRNKFMHEFEDPPLKRGIEEMIRDISDLVG